MTLARPRDAWSSRTMSAHPQAEPAGYVYDIPCSTVSLAGGIDALFDLFASRLRGYFRYDECVQVYLDPGAIYVDCDDALSGLHHVGAARGDVIQLRFEMATAARDAWSTAHQAVADLIAVWPEISAWRALPPPPAPPSDLTLIAQARALVIADQRASTSYLQRKLQVGYSKAAGLMEQLERDGIVSTPNAAGKRKVLVDA